jgi:50S ribosomal protein L16 3-hydroxylase
MTQAPASRRAKPFQAPMALLGGLSAQAFMAEYWQRQPLVISGALQAATLLPSRAQLFAMSAREDVESRLVQQHPKHGWTFKRGPFNRLPAKTQAEWTLLVQGVDLHHPGAHALMQMFRFIPDARIDDVMISWASDRGDVGPHTDRYDVFLLQVHGQRRWRLAPPADYAMVEGMPLKIIDGFKHTQEFVLNPGDMLYLPPMWAHEGVAVGGDCMTASIGFTVPEAGDLVRELATRMAEHWEDELLYEDPDQMPTAQPARVPAALHRFAQKALARMLKEPQAMACALGEWLSEPKAQVWFEPSATVWGQGDMVLDHKTKMMFDAHHVFINGEGFVAQGHDAQCLHDLANQRCLKASVWQTMGDDALAVMAQWHELGWLHMAKNENSY